MKPTPHHLTRIALHDLIAFYIKQRNNYVDYLMAGQAEYFNDKHNKCFTGALLPYERDHILKEIKRINWLADTLFAYDAHITLMVESGAVITSFEQWVAEKLPKEENLSAEKLNAIKAGKSCLVDNVSLPTSSRFYLDKILRLIEPTAKCDTMLLKDKYFIYDKKDNVWVGSKDPINNLPFVKLSDVMHLD